MDSSSWFDTINLGWSIGYTEGTHCISFAESVEPDEMPHYAYKMVKHVGKAIKVNNMSLCRPS